MHRLKLDGFFSTELQSNWCCLPSVYRRLYIIWFLHVWCLTPLVSCIVLVYDPIKVEMCFIRNQMSSMISMLFTDFANIWRRSLGMLHNLDTCFKWISSFKIVCTPDLLCRLHHSSQIAEGFFSHPQYGVLLEYLLSCRDPDFFRSSQYSKNLLLVELFYLRVLFHPHYWRLSW